MLDAEHLIKAEHILSKVYDKVDLMLNGTRHADDLFDPRKNEFILAGGAIRDLLLGRQVKDFDIVLNAQVVSPEIKWRVCNTDEAYTNTIIKYIGTCGPLEFLVREGVDPTPDDCIVYHCCGLSNVFYNGTALIIDQTFIEDVRDKVVRLSRKCHRDMNDSTATYLARIHKKYPEYRLEL